MSRSVRWHIYVFCAFRFGILGFCSLGGCASSPPVEYFALEPIEPQGQTIAAAPISIQIAQVHIPPSLDRQQVVRHNGAYTLDISDRHRWSAPLDEMIRRVLSQDLMQVLSPDRVVLPKESAKPATRKVVVNVLEFAPDASGTIQFEGTWSVVFPDSHASPQSRFVRLSQRADANDTTDQVKGMSRILERLATLMAQALAEPPR
jgi:uncharacterized lipoprotein YmbA